MSRSIILSNGELAVALDSRAQVRDIYYPHVGLEDHVRGHYIHRIGAWVDGELSWFTDNEWQISISSEEDALISSVSATHRRLQVHILLSDLVHHEKAVFFRSMQVKNLADREREIKIYVNQQFEIYKSHGGDTAFFDPQTHAVIHYKGRRVFLISGTLEGEHFQDYVTGLANFAGHEGSHKDAEDGVLSKNPIEHGPADSVVGFYGIYATGQTKQIFYWVAAAQTIPDVREIDSYIHAHKPERLLEETRAFWREWVLKNNFSFYGLSADHVALFKRSLLLVKAHADNDGGIIASLDSDMLNYGLDTYSYVWPRDSAYAALALDSAGDHTVARNLFEFCKEVLFKDGYLLHKYLPNRSLGSSWHPWIRNGHAELPIQEDETAIIVYAIGAHYAHTQDLQFLESMYADLVERAADFMVSYRDQRTHLPLASYDLWEEKRGISAYTAATVYGALEMAAEMSRILGKAQKQEKYHAAAAEVREAILAHLWDEQTGVFLKHVNIQNGEIVRDTTLDASSVYGVFAFDVLPHDDPRLKRAFDATIQGLGKGITAGGIPRYLGDNYYRNDQESAGNPWIVTTLWYAEYLIANARTDADMEPVRAMFEWVVQKQLPSGVLSEQLSPTTGEQLSVAPLTWSHSAYVCAVIKYLHRLEELGIARAHKEH